MTIEKTTGDLLSSDADALVNTVNCVGVMGKGIALQFKRRFPLVYKEYAAACKRGEVEVGRMHVVPTGQLEGPRWVINFPTKKHWRSPSKLDYVAAGLDDLRRVLVELEITSVAIPPLGAGNGGLDWADVAPLIVAALHDLPNVRAIVYEPSSEVRTIAPPERISMTWGRALLIILLDRYVAQRQSAEPWEDPRGASHLEIQKLMYFAELFKPELNLQFAPGRYGPYSERVRHLLQGMEGGFTAGLGDGNDPVLSLRPIAATERGRAEAERFVSDGDYGYVGDLVEKVLTVVKGFEGPYGIELLASSDWVCRHQWASDSSEATKLVRGWSDRKGRLFTKRHVSRAVEQLVASGAL